MATNDTDRRLNLLVLRVRSGRNSGDEMTKAPLSWPEALSLDEIDLERALERPIRVGGAGMSLCSLYVRPSEVLDQATRGRMAFIYGTADKITRRVGATLSAAGSASFETVITGGLATSALPRKTCIGVKPLAGSATGACVLVTTRRTGISEDPRLHPRSLGLKTTPNNRHHHRGGLWLANFMPKPLRNVPSA